MYTPERRIMYIGGGWGDAIYFLNDDVKNRIYGFKGRGKIFAEGSVLFDLANNKNNDTIPLYYISNIEWKEDPRDMFFADISLIGNIRNPKVGYYEEYKEGWYKETLPELIDQYKKEIKKTNFFRFYKRYKLHRYMNTLKEMLSATEYVYKGFI